MTTIGMRSDVDAVVVARTVYPLPEPARTDALARACSHLDMLFSVAGTFGDLDALMQQESAQGRVAHLLSRRESVEAPLVRYVHMESPLDILSQIPPAFIATGGLTGLLYLAKRTLTFNLEVTERAEYLKARAAHWESERSKSELQTLEHYARIAEAELAIDSPPQLQIDTDD
jgi:hypothetical protein